MQGGVVVSQDGNALAPLPLRIGELMSTEDPQQVVQDKMEVYEAYKARGGQLTDPIIAMSFFAAAGHTGAQDNRQEPGGDDRKGSQKSTPAG